MKCKRTITKLLKDKFYLDDDDIKDLEYFPLGTCLDSLDIVDFVLDIEEMFDIIFTEEEYFDWKDKKLNDIIQMVEVKVDYNGLNYDTDC